MIKLHYDTQGMSHKEVAKMVLSYLGIKTRPLHVSFLNGLFDHLEKTSNLNHQVDILSEENDTLHRENEDLREELSMSMDNNSRLRKDVSFISERLTSLQLSVNPIDWQKVCQEFGSNRIAILRAIRNSHDLNLETAERLVKENLVTIPNIGKGFNQVEIANPQSYVYQPIVVEKAREIKVEVATASAYSGIGKTVKIEGIDGLPIDSPKPIFEEPKI